MSVIKHSLNIDRVPVSIPFPRSGNVFEFYQIRKCPRKNIDFQKKFLNFTKLGNVLEMFFRCKYVDQ